MTAHDHREYVAGCFRCDLSRDEIATPEYGVAYNTENTDLLWCLTREEAERIVANHRSNPGRHPHAHLVVRDIGPVRVA